ncbi:hypothetical protein [Halolamina sediminis]|uniref:hypothetical protein n=1 Tax=Halolamina sediminis TaxID=1480675 RepID=UPI0006B46A0D|nr:hypothetical protein [Halolamina sediminis]
MNTTKLLTVLVAALVVSAGAGAVTAQTDDASADTSIEANYDDGTVTLSVAQNGTGVENVSVEANSEDVGATDANGTLTFETNATEELELELEGEGIDQEVEYVIEDGELVRESDEDDDDEAELAADVTFDNGTVDLTVTQNGSGVENASVTANGEDVGTTDANGSLTFETNASEELEIEITSGEQELELEYAIEDGELVEESDDEAGPDENASDRAKNVFAVIQNWLDSGQEGNLGQLIQEQLGNGNDDAPGNSDEAPGNSDDAPGNSDDAPGNSDDAPGNSDDAPGNSDDAPGNSDEAPGQSDDESDDESESESESDDEDEEDEDDDEDDEDDEEEDEDDDSNPGNGNGKN